MPTLGLVVYLTERENEYHRMGSFQARGVDNNENGEDTGFLLAQNWKERSNIIVWNKTRAAETGDRNVATERQGTCIVHSQHRCILQYRHYHLEANY